MAVSDKEIVFIPETLDVEPDGRYVRAFGYERARAIANPRDFSFNWLERVFPSCRFIEELYPRPFYVPIYTWDFTILASAIGGNGKCVEEYFKPSEMELIDVCGGKVWLEDEKEWLIRAKKEFPEKSFVLLENAQHERAIARIRERIGMVFVWCLLAGFAVLALMDWGLSFLIWVLELFS